MARRWIIEPPPANREIIVIGCGGTGGYVAEGLCRLLAGSGRQIMLIDHDRVEEHNLRRQNFFEGDLGRFKSEALAERLSRRYGRVVPYSVMPLTERHSLNAGIVIGCVDNALARAAIASNYRSPFTSSWWIDSGNNENSGQVLIGNDTTGDHLKGAFGNGKVSRLPSPSLQHPALLTPDPKPALDCAEAVAADEQSPVINQMMASLVLAFVHKLLTGTLTWMTTYIDLETGTMRAVEAEPKTVARIAGLTAGQVAPRRS